MNSLILRNMRTAQIGVDGLIIFFEKEDMISGDRKVGWIWKEWGEYDQNKLYDILKENENTKKRCEEMPSLTIIRT